MRVLAGLFFYSGVFSFSFFSLSLSSPSRMFSLAAKLVHSERLSNLRDFIFTNEICLRRWGFISPFFFSGTSLFTEIRNLRHQMANSLVKIRNLGHPMSYSPLHFRSSPLSPSSRPPFIPTNDPHALPPFIYLKFFYCSLIRSIYYSISLTSFCWDLI